MPGNADPSRIYHDPALTDRRGDATGLVAFAFLFVLVGVFALAAFVLVSLPLAADSTPAPPATPGILATPRPSPKPALTATPSDAPSSGEPSIGPAETFDTGASPAPQPSDGALPTREPRPSPTQRTGRPAAEGAIGQTLPVFIDGRRVGGVTVQSFQVGDVPGVDLPAGARFMILEVRYFTAAGMDYDAKDWVVVDSEGNRYPSLGAQAPEPALGKGTLAAGETIIANVAFIRERRVGIEQLVLTDGDGRDIVIVDRTTAEP